MSDQCDSGNTLEVTKSDTKRSEKRHLDMEERHEISRKQVKMRDLESVLRNEGLNSSTGFSRSSIDKGFPDKFQDCEEDMSQVTREAVSTSLLSSQGDENDKDHSAAEVNVVKTQLDLNIELSLAGKSFGDTDDASLSSKPKTSGGNDSANSRGLDLNLSAEEVSSSVNPNPFHPYKNLDQLKRKDDSECASTTGPLEEKDPLKIWKEMKQNGFLSSSHGGIPIPKKRGRKNKDDMLKKKMEMAKREQVDRFTKMAAPSGLLNGLNPGIINHVRNSKQVQSIIQSLVQSEKLENTHDGSKHSSHFHSVNKETSNRMNLGASDGSGMHPPCYSSENSIPNPFIGVKHAIGFSERDNRALPFTPEDEDEDEDGESGLLEKHCSKSFGSYSNPLNQASSFVAKLSSSLSKASEIVSSMSNEDSGTATSVSSLSLKAAGIASQWLELLHQDIKGRLAALRRSRKRVQGVITTDLPLLISKEFSSNQLKTNSMDMHQLKWGALFDQMDRALAEEEQQLEGWLKQVKDMLQHCEQGLQHVQLNPGFGLQNPQLLENFSRSGKVDDSDRELAVRAAAASIYSTCNFAFTKENVPCC